MQEVTCHQCRNIVPISPDSDHCSVCGENLKALLEPDFISGYFYERARDTASSGNLIEALAEAQRGLRQQQSTELHLLAAILAQKLERFDDMRNHVAAIPVDDPLRPEGEWLLRSHQENQRAIREQIRSGRTSRLHTSEAPNRASGLQDVINRPAPVTDITVRRRRLLPRLALLGGVVVTAMLAVVIWSPVTPPVMDKWPILFGVEAGAPTATDMSTSAGDRPPQVERGAVTPMSQQEATPIPLATSVIPNDLVQDSQDPDALVDSDPSSSVLVPAENFDFGDYLRSNGYLELAELPVTARVRTDTLVLDGIVHMDVDRRQLLKIASDIPGITTVNSVDLLLRPLPTYTVQAGDSLYSIVFDIYGDVRYADEFYEYNTDVLSSRDNLPVGVELRVPPID